MNTENGCRWYFGPEGGVDNGPTAPSKGSFSAIPDIAVVREAIQNSLDVPASDAPVEVDFSFSEIRHSEFPAFFEIRDHIAASFEFYKNTERAKEKYPPMLDYMSKGKYESPASPYTESLGVLTISDRNTTGMEYKADDTTCKFYAFFHSIGVSIDKQNGSGGSNGLGKETLYNRSEIKTLLLSSQTQNGAVVFQGACKLTTHRDPHTGNKVTAFGYYGQTDDLPITDRESIPECFRRNETGTDVHIVGVDLSDKDKVRNSIVQAVLNHFWMAIHEGRLRVNVDGTSVDKNSVGELIRLHFPDTRETKADDYVKWNPRPYYEAVLRAEGGQDKTAIEEQELPTVGKVRMYLDWSAPDLPKRIAYLRMPKMVIFKKTRRLSSFVAVFVCDNSDGNSLLKSTEPPAHNEWKIEYYEGSDKTPRRKAIKEVSEFVEKTLEKFLRPQGTTNQLIIPGVAEYLPDTDERTEGGEKGSVGSGSADGLKHSGTLAANETAAATSYVEEDQLGKGVDVKPEETGAGIGVVEDKFPGEDGEPAETFQGETDGEPNPEPGPSADENTSAVQTTLVDAPGRQAHRKVKVVFKIAGRKRDGRYWHTVFIKPAPDEDIDVCKSISISLTTGTDNGMVDKTIIERVENLPSGTFSVEKNKIIGLDAHEKAKFDVLFNDNVLHSVKVVASATDGK